MVTVHDADEKSGSPYKEKYNFFTQSLRSVYTDRLVGVSRFLWSLCKCGVFKQAFSILPGESIKTSDY